MSGNAVGFLVLATALVAVVALFVVLSRLRSDDLVAALRSGQVPEGLTYVELDELAESLLNLRESASVILTRGLYPSVVLAVAGALAAIALRSWAYAAGAAGLALLAVALWWAYRRRTSRLDELLLQVDERLADPREA
ncbi:hypothetical protein [Solicola sp. PLA-1-18]|uniref:hypothetical protein n=1 Tax=Solicola sp. PLA-1-18 TaxID=3380532 RepID=UPI003B801BE1